MQILNLEEINQVPTKKGVYKIYVKDNQSNLIPINRFCNIDHSGLLYIGRTIKQDLKKRIYQFYASSNVNMLTHNHSGGLKYSKIPIIREALGKNHFLYFDFEPHDYPKARETELLQDYALIFGEYPPLNK